MSGGFDWNGAGSLLGQDAAQVVVALYDADSGEMEVLPNVVCDSIEERIGFEPPVARLRYLLDVLAESDGFPTAVEDLWPLDAQGPYVVKADDRLVVLTYSPDGDPIYLFDGHAQVPQVDVSPSSSSVGFTAVSVAARCFDFPVGGRKQRDADDLDAGDVVQTDLPTRFNPTDRDGRSLKNCTPDGHDVDQADDARRYPVFVEENLERASGDTRRFWDLSGICRYLMAVYNGDEEFVKNPDFSVVDAFLKVRYPKDESGEYDPSDPDTYDEQEIPVREYDATNRCWPEAMTSLLEYSGFGFVWYLTADEAGLPRTSLDLFRLDQASERAPKVVWLDAQNADLDPTRNTVESLHLARDVNQVVNAWTVETRPRRVELSVVLAPWFTPAAGDETSGNRARWLKSSLAGVTDSPPRRKYRFYVADEAGDGHWDYATSTFTTTAPIDLSPVFPPIKAGEAEGEEQKDVPTYVARLRPGSYQLVGDDSIGRPLRAFLAYSQDYTGPVASIWDGTGTWTTIGGGWQLLPDRLGIEVTIEDPEQWYIGKLKGEIRGVTWQANPPTGKQFYLRLTTVVDDDLTLDTKVDKRIASPTKFERRRRVDGSDVYRMERIHKSSPNYVPSADDGGFQVVRDDTQLGIDHANMLRAAHETPPLAGSVTLPFLTDAYRVGDRVRAIKGREISLQANVAEGQGEAPFYPTVVAIGRSFAGDRQSTTLQLSDRRAEPQGG